MKQILTQAANKLIDNTKKITNFFKVYKDIKYTPDNHQHIDAQQPQRLNQQQQQQQQQQRQPLIQQQLNEIIDNFYRTNQRNDITNTVRPVSGDDDEKKKEQRNASYAAWLANEILSMLLEDEINITDEEIDARVEKLHNMNPQMSIEECVERVLDIRATMHTASLIQRAANSIDNAKEIAKESTIGIIKMNAYTKGEPIYEFDKHAALARYYIKAFNLQKTDEVKKLQDATLPIAERSIIINKIIEDLKEHNTDLLDRFKADLSKTYVAPKDLEGIKNISNIEPSPTEIAEKIFNKFMNASRSAYNDYQEFKDKRFKDVCNKLQTHFNDTYKSNINKLREAAKDYNEENQTAQLDVEECIKDYDSRFNTINENMLKNQGSAQEVFPTVRNMYKLNNFINDIETQIKEKKFSGNKDLQESHQHTLKINDKFIEGVLGLQLPQNIHAHNMSMQLLKKSHKNIGFDINDILKKVWPNQGQNQEQNR